MKTFDRVAVELIKEGLWAKASIITRLLNEYETLPRFREAHRGLHLQAQTCQNVIENAVSVLQAECKFEPSRPKRSGQDG